MALIKNAFLINVVLWFGLYVVFAPLLQAVGL